MNQFDTKMTELADAIKAKNDKLTGKLSIQGMINGVKTITISGGKEKYYKPVSVNTFNKTWQGALVYESEDIPLFAFYVNYNSDQQWYFPVNNPEITKLEDSSEAVDYSNATFKCPWLASDTVSFDASMRQWVIMFNGTELRSNIVADTSLPPWDASIWTNGLVGGSLLSTLIFDGVLNTWRTPAKCSSYPLVNGTYSDKPPYTGDSGMSGELLDIIPDGYNPAYTIDCKASRLHNTLNIGHDITAKDNGMTDIGGQYYPHGTTLTVNVEGEGETTDFSQVTAEPRYVLSMMSFFDNNGALVEGTAENYLSDWASSNVSASFSDLSVERDNGTDVGYIVLTTDKISDTAIVDKGTHISAIVPNLIPENIKHGVTIGQLTGEYEGEGSDVSGVTASPGDVLEGVYFVDDSGSLREGLIPRYSGVTEFNPGDTIDLRGVYVDAVFNIRNEQTGAPPAQMPFYLAVALDGALTEIIVYSGRATDDVGEPYSLQGTYTIIDPGAKGTARRWYCSATTEDGDYMSSRMVIGCCQHEVGFDNNGDIQFEERWGFFPQAATAELQEWYCMAMATTTGHKSPFHVTAWEGGGMCGVVTAPEMTSAVPDSEPYGPSSWSGREMIWHDNRKIYVTKGSIIEDANGIWYRVDEGQPLSADTVFININGKAKILIPPSPNEYIAWEMQIEGYDNSPYRPLNGSFLASNIPDPFDPTQMKWTNLLSNQKPVPAASVADRGYFPSDEVTANLTIKGNAPIIGGIYNSDATIKAGNLYPA